MLLGVRPRRERGLDAFIDARLMLDAMANEKARDASGDARDHVSADRLD